MEIKIEKIIEVLQEKLYEIYEPNELVPIA